VSRKRKDYLIPAPDDGLVVADVGRWAAHKYRHVGMYAEIFSTAMKRQFDTRVYVDLFAGPGHVRLRGTGSRVLSSPLIALSVPDRFDKYVFCDRDDQFVAALRTRAKAIAPDTDIECISADVNQAAAQIGGRIPPHSKTRRVLSFCFADPFDTKIRFDAIRTLGAGRKMDFLLLLPIGMDAKRNWTQYLMPGNPRIDSFLGDAEWRPRWAEAVSAGRSTTQFIAEEYSRGMQRIGYRPMPVSEMILIRSDDRNLPLYYLAFFSKDKLGYKLWGEVRKYSTDQLPLL
jgi:three-Cys-motif partner protein